MTKALTLYFVVFTPMASAAIWFSRTARKGRPTEEGTNGHEAGVTHGELPGVAVDDVQRHRQRHVDADGDDDAVVVVHPERHVIEQPSDGDDRRHGQSEIEDVAEKPGEALQWGLRHSTFNIRHLTFAISPSPRFNGEF